MRGRPKTTGCRLADPLDVPWGASQNDLEAVEDILSATSLGSVRSTAARSRKGSQRVSAGHGCSAGVTAPAVCVRQKTSAKKSQQVPATGPSGLSTCRAMRPAATDAEEFVLDDRDLLRLHELPYKRKAPQRHLHPAAHLRTVSIIDTLSALAQGAADRDYPLPKVTTGAPPRYQRKAAPQLSYARRHRSRGESTRLCMSDSEVKGGDAGSVLSLRTQPASRKTPSHHGVPGATSTPLRNRNDRAGNTATTRARGWTRVPDWIRAIFRVARKGDLDSLMASLRDMDTTLIWNLSDSHGNNLWHVCAACNHLRCFQWLCQKDVHHVITDENRGNLTPVGCAVKHGSIQIIQWLVSKNIALDQLNPPEGHRTLLHLAAKYGQEKVVRWLVEYMNNNDLNISRKDSEGNTAVHLAAKYGHVPALKVLILHGADITAKNEQGLRPHGLAVQSGKLACADYLLTMEACLSLSSEHIVTEGNFQCLQQENADMRSGFKELLVLTKRLLRRQEEMLHYMQSICNSSKTATSDEAESDFSSLPRNVALESKEGNDVKLTKLQYVLEKAQMKVLPEEEARLLQLEEKWRRLRTNKCVADTRSPLDLVRSHFAQAHAKCSDPSIPTEVHLASSSGSSLSNYSGESAAEEDEKRTPAWLTASQQPWDQALLSHNKVQAFLDSLILPQQQVADVKSSQEVKSSSAKAVNGGAAGFKPRSDEHKTDGDRGQENVSLRVLFEKNPELRQESKTCSVLEVLEPSSSEGEEEFGGKDIKNSGSGDSSSSSFRSTKGYKNSTFRVVENKGKKSAPSLRPDVQVSTMKDNGHSHSILVTNIAELPDSRYRFSLKIQQSQDCEHGNVEGQQSCPEDPLVIEKAPQAVERRNKNVEHQLTYPEPDLIRGTKQATPPSPPSGSTMDVNLLNNSIQESTHSRETVCQESVREEDAEEVRDIMVAPTLERQESITEVTPLGGTKKRSGFLLKFSLKGRWTSKQKQQQKKCEEISPEEFRETYTRNGAIEIPSPSSHEHRVEDSSLQEHTPFLPQEVLHKEPPPPMPMIPLLRREPPPVPLHAPSISSDATPSFKEGNPSEDGLIYSASSLARPESILSKTTGGSLSRPASSASQTEDHRRSRSAGFMLQKALSSNELLLHTPDSSVAGRQSPAPSEVSKTESALSPPSDVSKTESARHPPHLGKIEEIVTGQSGEATSKKVTLATDVSLKKEAEGAEAAVTCLQDVDTQQEKVKKTTPSVRKIRRSSKPWYEVSDEEDILIPDKYQTARARSSSDDEVEVAVVA